MNLKDVKLKKQVAKEPGSYKTTCVPFFSLQSKYSESVKLAKVTDQENGCLHHYEV